MTKDGKVGIGIIGFGGIAQAAHAPGYRKVADQCEIVAVADIDPKRLDEAKSEKWNIQQTFEDYKEMLALPEIDAVSVCTPNYVHMQPTIDAFAAGKHVLCEKPMAMNADEAKQMIAAAKQAGKQLQIGYNMRFGSGPQALKRAIEAGEFGEIYHARAQAIRRRGVPGWGVFIEKDKQGGGPLIDIGVHITDMTLWLMGHPKPVAASGTAVTKFGTKEGVLGQMGKWDPKKYTVEDFATAYVRFDNGATYSLESSFIANIAKEEFSTHLFGTGAGAYLNASSNDVNIYREEFGTLTNSQPGWLPRVESSHGEEVKVFVKAVKEGLDVASLGAASGEQALMVTQIMDAIYKSSDLGREVTIE
ncbi:MAG: Gfo/Idh/MocA family oxidoreductase [Armatimonadota bacterium]